MTTQRGHGKLIHTDGTVAGGKSSLKTDSMEDDMRVKYKNKQHVYKRCILPLVSPSTYSDVPKLLFHE